VSAGNEVTYACSPPPGVARVDVVLPCLDAARVLPRLLARVPEGYRAIVVDTGSTDGSAQVAAAHGATVVHEAERGSGAACAAGLAAATAPVVAFLDADAGLDPAELPLVAEPVVRGSVDLVLGRPAPTPRRAWSWRLRPAGAGVRRRRHRRTGVRLPEPGAMRAGRREGLLRLGLGDRRSGSGLEMAAAAADAGWRVAEVPVGSGPAR
jgi:glycosyltransferase involved in cell wall biosynthesis